MFCLFLMNISCFCTTQWLVSCLGLADSECIPTGGEGDETVDILWQPAYGTGRPVCQGDAGTLWTNLGQIWHHIRLVYTSAAVYHCSSTVTVLDSLVTMLNRSSAVESHIYVLLHLHILVLFFWHQLTSLHSLASSELNGNMSKQIFPLMSQWHFMIL